MSKVVYKYPITLSGKTISTHAGAKVLHVAYQDGTLCVWVEVDTEKAERDLLLEVYGTGHPIPDDRVHVGTVQDGPFVWHVYRQMTLWDVMRGVL